ncbi:MAG: V-type ATP synthase subunit I [Candidatus Omnitrophica bacterium]|nr:V-type ATP synthase subunit I [Candidatus Omnitrophota bacterium]
MAIARLKKLKILIHNSEKERLFETLQRKGSVQIIDLRTRISEGEYSLFISSDGEESPRIKILDSAGQDLLWLIKVMSGANKTKRYTMTQDEFRDIAQNFDYHPILNKAKEIESLVKDLDSARHNILQSTTRFLPWVDLEADLKDIGVSGHTITGLAVLDKASFIKLKEELPGHSLDVCIEQVHEADNKVFTLFCYLKQDEDAAEQIFKKHGMEHVYFPQCCGVPKGILSALDKELHEVSAKKKSAIKELTKLASYKKQVMALFDNFYNLNNKESAEEKLLKTELIYIAEGWVKESEARILKKQMETEFPEVELFLEDPAPEDNVPVLLENNRLLEPFELITKIYGMPAYNELDPTPFLAPFFFVFFGFCITDAAYGFILVFVSFYVLKKFKMGWMGNRFFRLLLYGGISTVILGALTGGWFGNLIDVLAQDNKILLGLKHAKDSIVLLDPLKEPMKLLIIALSLGLLQIWSAHIIAIYGNLKNRRYLDALFDQGSTLVFLFGFTGIILNVLGVLPKQHLNLFIVSMIMGGAGILFTAGRHNLSIGSKMFSGAFTLYNTCSGYISDILSYSRLWALGLVTGVMAQTCNMMAVILSGMMPMGGFLLGVLIIISGHIFSLVMNLLGAFIHPTRLQFVEFFSKFFKGGGKEFQPLRLENKYTIVE